MPESRPGATVQLAATTAGGHASAQVPLHVLLASVSLVNAYSVRPSGPTRIWPSGEVAAFTETEAPAAVGCCAGRCVRREAACCDSGHFVRLVSLPHSNS